MSKLKGQSINEKLHNREMELRKEGKTNMMNTIKTLEKEGKTAKEILTTF